MEHAEGLVGEEGGRAELVDGRRTERVWDGGACKVGRLLVKELSGDML